jgi:hypothetical protein
MPTFSDNKKQRNCDNGKVGRREERGWSNIKRRKSNVSYSRSRRPIELPLQ